MSQAPNPFTQAASQGYGDFAPTLDEDDEQEDNNMNNDDHEELPEGPQSPEPEQEDEAEEAEEAEEEEGHELNEHGFTQTQERSYPTGIESPDEDENQVEMSDNDEEAVGPSSPPVEEEPNEQQEEKDDDDDDEEQETNRKQSQSQSRRRVQIMNDSDNEDDDQPQPTKQSESTSAVSKEKNRHFLKQLTMSNEESPKKHKKRRSDEHHQEKKSKRIRQEHSDAEDDNNTEEKNQDNTEEAGDVDEVVDDIFGNVADDNEGEGDDQAEVAAELADLNDNEAVQQDEEEEDDDGEQQTFDAEEDEVSERKDDYPVSKKNVLYDIDVYLEKKAEKRRGNRRRGGKNGDVDLAGADSDEFVSKLIEKMKIATEEDRVFNKSRQPATAKLLLLPTVEQQLCRADLMDIFIENGILNVFKDWLSPLPDKSLPNIKIRESLIRILSQFGSIGTESLRESGIGKALMYLYKHPRETKENKIKLIKIIHDWARPIFNLDTDYKHLKREERQQRDADQALLKRQRSSTGKPKNRSADVDLPFLGDKRQDDDEDDCPRARVPRPSNKDYVVRPVSTVEYSEKNSGSKKKTISRLDEIKRRQQDRKRQSKPMSIVKLSIEGNKMHL